MKLIGLYLSCLLILSGCAENSVLKETRILMDTFVEISCYGSDTENISDAVEAAFKEIERIEKLLNRFDKNSEVSMVNAFAGIEPVMISPELLGLVERSGYYSGLSKGAFDITVMPLVDMWKDNRPDDKDVEVVLESVGYKKIVLDKGHSTIHFLHKGTKIDLGAIAKGYAVDRAVNVLRSRGIKRALVNIGGNIFAMGAPNGRKYWKIGIRDPRHRDGIIDDNVPLTNQAVSTSGDYERPSHIINPFTGRPAEDIGSVTVIAPSAEQADALSTAVFVMGKEEGEKLAGEGIRVVFH